MFNLRKHLDSDERMVYFFRPSRKAYLHQYIIYLALITVCVYFMLYFSNNMWFSYAFALLGLYPLFGILKNEIIIFSSRYALTNERVLYSKGIFAERFRSFHYYSITDIELYQSFWGKIVNTGTLSINTSGTGSDNYEINFLNISDPLEVKKKINDHTPRKMHIGHVKVKDSEDNNEINVKEKDIKNK